MMRTGSTFWFARHEIRLAWREWLAVMTGGRKRRRWGFALGLAAFAVLAHWVAWVLVGRGPPASGMSALLALTGSGVLLLTVMTSQAMETVTRAFYSRADLDLVLSSPAPSHRLFAIRIVAMALSVTATSALVSSPLINVLAVTAGWQWLAAYLGIALIGMLATAAAAALVVLLFRTIGPRRTRLVAQVVAAVIGAIFVIGIQIVAIISYGDQSDRVASRIELLASYAPPADSIVWWPGRAILDRDPVRLMGMLAAGALLLWITVILLAPRFGRNATAATGTAQGSGRGRRYGSGFRAGSPAGTLRRKEWVLLLRDPWLLSQSLMQLLYLVVPVVLLWRSLGSGLDARALLVPILIMTAGQLAGGLTWVVVSGEDAPDLVATAPVSERAVVRAKLEAVMGAVALVFAPLIAVFALLAPFEALVAVAGVGISTASATCVQLWFRAQARRSTFRRRQQSSRIATFAEAFSSISWAFAGAMAAGRQWSAALVLALMALGVLAVVRWISPARATSG
jgi:ABC-2 type transport system permease protein